MWVDFLLLVSAGTSAFKLAIHHWISAQEAVVYLLVVALFLATTRAFGLQTFRRRTRAAEVLLSAVQLGVSVADGDLRLAAVGAVASIGIGVMGFGLYFMIAGSRDRVIIIPVVSFFAVAIGWWIVEQVKLQSGSDTFSLNAVLTVLQQRVAPQRTITLRVPAHGTSSLVSTSPLYRIIRWDIEEMRGIGMYEADGRELFSCAAPWPSMLNAGGEVVQLYFKSCRNSDSEVTLRFE
jgi:hypothetical protein